MAQTRMNRRALAAAAAAWLVFLVLVMMEQMVSAERLLKDKDPDQVFADQKKRPGVLFRVVHFFWQGDKSSYEPVWPVSFSLVFYFSTILMVFYQLYFWL